MPKKPRESDLPGVSGEFHSQGALKLAARVAQREGIPAERIWYLGEPATDRMGDPTGVVLPASLPREAALAGLVLGVLVGVLCAFLLPPQPFLKGLLRVVPRAVSMGLLGMAVGGLAAWASISGRLGGYLESVRAGSLRLKITLPPGATPEEARHGRSQLAAVTQLRGLSDWPLNLWTILSSRALTRSLALRHTPIRLGRAATAQPREAPFPAGRKARLGRSG
ncbi:MAG: hypothetical protein HYU66_22190 [Armatimonadetes bacterium]|nr:hypothetical protein [Armatimonadota bacterium]